MKRLCSLFLGHMRAAGALVFALAFVLCALPSRAQLGNAGSIEGTVKDQSGALVPGAKVEITNPNVAPIEAPKEIKAEPPPRPQGLVSEQHGLAHDDARFAPDRCPDGGRPRRPANPCSGSGHERRRHA